MEKKLQALLEELQRDSKEYGATAKALRDDPSQRETYLKLQASSFVCGRYAFRLRVILEAEPQAQHETPCQFCGEPINGNNVGHEFGCMIEPRYTLDGEPLDWQEFNDENPDLFDEYSEQITTLKAGESMNLGGGASPIFVLAREAE